MAKQDVSKVLIGRNGMVRFWNVFTQQWDTMNAASLATSPKYGPTLPASERERVCQYVARQTEKQRRAHTTGAHAHGHFG